jgi:predicted DNA-binding transcriptional regulator YafY
MVRVIALAQALTASRRGVVVSRFAAERGWSERYVRRDLKVLEEAGFPICGDRSRYWLPPDWAPHLTMEIDRDELVALFVARQIAEALRGTRAGEALDRLWTKLSARGGQGLLLPGVEFPIAVAPTAAVDYAPHRGTISVLERAIADRVVVSCRYRRPRTGEITERLIEPGELRADVGLGALYCIAWCRLRNDVRVFAVHRFLEVKATSERASRRSETRSRVALANAFRIWRGSATETVRLQFAEALASEICERSWHPTQRVERPRGGGVILTMEVADPTELERWLLGYGGEVRVLEPRWLDDRVQEAHRLGADRSDAVAFPPAAMRASREGRLRPTSRQRAPR